MRLVVSPGLDKNAFGNTKDIIQQKPYQRLQSLDALRGFDMLWIISGEFVVHALSKAWDVPVIHWMSNQLHHSDWNGFTFYDMIFPLFIYISGVSMPFSYAGMLSKAAGLEKAAAKRKIYIALFRRTLVLILCGLVINGLLKWQGYENTRFASVLARIALSCFFAAIIYLNCTLRGQIVWFLVILFGYWAAMKLVPVPGYGAGVLTADGNLSAYIDRLLLPGKLHRKVYDPEGIFSTIPAICTALLGVFTGQLLRWQHNSWNMKRKGLALAVAAFILMGCGLAWNTVFPINKIMWTSSFVLFAGGWSVLFFVIFYLVIDVAGYKKWSLPFVWIGTNSILIYMASHGLIDFESTARYLFGGFISMAGGLWQPVWLAVAVMFLQVALLYFLYKKKWFLKV
jgi:predicted acyltransferase